MNHTQDFLEVACHLKFISLFMHSYIFLNLSYISLKIFKLSLSLSGYRNNVMNSQYMMPSDFDLLAIFRARKKHVTCMCINVYRSRRAVSMFTGVGEQF